MQRSARGYVRFVVVVVGVAVEAFMQPGLTGVMQLKQVAFHMHSTHYVCAHVNLVTRCPCVVVCKFISFKLCLCDRLLRARPRPVAIGPCRRRVAWSAGPCWRPKEGHAFMDYPRRSTARRRRQRPRSQQRRPCSQRSAQPSPPFWASFSPCLRCS